MASILIEERLNDEKHLRTVSDFCCGTNEGLDNFLKSEAFEYNREGQGNTYLIWMPKKSDVVGYFTLKADSIEAYNEEEKRVVALPAVEIARFAIQEKYQRNGFGTAIFGYHIVPKINAVKEIIGVNTIMVFVEDQDGKEYYQTPEEKKIKNFYSKLGFKLAEEEVQRFIRDDYNEGCRLMYMSTDKLDQIQSELYKSKKIP